MVEKKIKKNIEKAKWEELKSIFIEVFEAREHQQTATYRQFTLCINEENWMTRTWKVILLPKLEKMSGKNLIGMYHRLQLE